jgi:dTDP-4-dehydrorhamnose reductase
MRVYVLGYKGMLGRYVYTYLKSKNFDVVGISRNELDATVFNEQTLGSALYLKGLKKNDVVINCIGTIKPQVDKLGILVAIKINSIFPHILSNVCEKEGYKMIHITTDCVFSGKDGLYNETSPHDCTDVYGKTKSLGEPTNCTVIRTSIIGEEVDQQRSLMEWVKSMNGKKANGFINHKWNGLTCFQVAKIFEDIITNNKYWKGVRHIFSPNIMTKLELVSTIAEIYDLNIDVVPSEATTKCDRSLSTIYNDIVFEIPDIEAQIQEQYYTLLSYQHNKHLQMS